jgi:hypothetical protein
MQRWSADAGFVRRRSDSEVMIHDEIRRLSVHEAFVTGPVWGA